MKKLTYLRNAYKTLADYDKDIRQRIITAIDKIHQGDIKKLQGEKYLPLYRLRVRKLSAAPLFDTIVAGIFATFKTDNKKGEKFSSPILTISNVVFNYHKKIA